MTSYGKTINTIGNAGYAEGGGHLCAPNHVFVFAGAYPDGKVPEGYPCSCGLYKAHWTKCPTCGQDHLTLIDNI
jgi:hypothetical protein